MSTTPLSLSEVTVGPPAGNERRQKRHCHSLRENIVAVVRVVPDVIVRHDVAGKDQSLPLLSYRVTA